MHHTNFISLRVFRLLGLASALIVLAAMAPASAETIGKGPVNARMETASSPYLRSHSRDLVRWYRWGKEAFAKARELNRPIIVSFGYTACHWCHVMQTEHFNDESIAQRINDEFVPILVDRERRATLDDTYMLVTELLTQRGGWPNTVFLTPQLKPFYGTAYVPSDIFAPLLQTVIEEWAGNREPIIAESERIATIITGFLTRKEQARPVTPAVLASTAQSLVSQFDPFAGGIGEAPKFFRPPILVFLLQRYERDADAKALEVVERTLQSVLSGGIHDHIEGGFHRYAIDPGWRVPHFEKMLYDQAQMAEVFTAAYRLTGKPEYAATARKTLDYVLNDLTAPGGGFYAARDADSEGEEGTYYVWTPEQLVAALGAADAAYAADVFGTIADGDFAGKIILNFDQVRGQSVPRLNKIVERLGEARKSRPKPRRDDKIILGWNGLVIASLAEAAATFGDERYRDAAIKAGDFIWSSMRTPDGRLMRSYFDGTAEVDGELDDYAQLARALIRLFDLTADTRWLNRAIELAAALSDGFEDAETGDFYSTRSTAGFGRTKPRSDVDQASGNGVALDVLARLAQRSIDPRYKRKAEAALAALSGVALGAPAGGASILAAADRFQRGETGTIQFAGKGTVRIVSAAQEGAGQISLQLAIADGWHINGDKPLEDHLIPTKLELLRNGKPVDAQIGYPEPLTKKLAFNDKPMALFENRFRITADIAAGARAGLEARLEVQVCSDELCLLPETVRMHMGFADTTIVKMGQCK